MATRRKRVSAQDMLAMARRAVDEVAAAENRDAVAAQVLATGHGRALAQAVLELASGAPDDVAAAFVRAGLRNGDTEMARTAAELLGGISSSEAAIDILQESFRMRDPRVRSRAVDAIEGFDDPVVLSFLADALEDESTAVRRTASSQLSLLIASRYHPLSQPTIAALGDPASPLAGAVLGNDDDQVREQVAQAIGFINSDIMLPTLVKLSQDPDEVVRQEAVLALAAIGTAAAVQKMGACLSDPSFRVASVVLDMLAARLGAGSTALLAYLKAAMKHDRAEVRRQAVLMFDRFHPDQVADVLGAATHDSDFEVARRAAEVMTGLGVAIGVDWLADGLAGRAGDKRTFLIWETGNLGESQRENVIPILEGVLRRGSSSDKLHAIAELVRLKDIGTSDAMQTILDDRDENVRSRTADMLSVSGDAALLVRVAHSHVDPMLRRRSIEALMHNPGGRRSNAALTGASEFESARTQGVELFSLFLHALKDADEGVQQHACEAIRRYAQRIDMLPVAATIEALDQLADDDGASFLMQEEAVHAVETVRKIRMPAFIGDTVEDVRQWLHDLSRQATAIQWNAESGAYTLSGVQAPVLESWAGYGLSGPTMAALQQSASTGAPLDAAEALPLLTALSKDIVAAMGCLGSAARALAAIGREASERYLNAWHEALDIRIAPEWDDGASDLARAIERSRQAARVDVASACGAPDTIRELADSDDDWVVLYALAAVGEPDERMLQMCRRYAVNAAFARPVGRACVALMRTGAAAADCMATVLRLADVDTRANLTHALAVAAQTDTVADAVRSYVAGAEGCDTGVLAMALALHAAGGAVDLVVDASSDDTERNCAALALRTMRGEVEAADELELLLRNGAVEARHIVAHYLSIARVRSAAPVFASVQEHALPMPTRMLCAASALRRGRSPLGWMNKVLKGMPGADCAAGMTYFSRAVEDSIALMLRCTDVNVGRFV
jgi:HEAT repeat protein